MTRLLSYYGDDFTGSTDVMEALASHGVETVLFTRIPTEKEFSVFSNHQAFGLAGTSRSQTPDWMDEHLPVAFNWLKSLGANYCHYKVCSTFDSSPEIGNIGRAIEIGMQVFAQAMVPLIVGAPQLKRYSFAGHLFAGYQGEVFRIDRHPVMSRHPVTPMREADLRLHLAQQTHVKTETIAHAWPREGIALYDVHNAETQVAAGQSLLQRPGGFVAGSSGVEYALVKALAAEQRIAGHAKFPPLHAVAQTIVVSGSVSPTTERQIRHAMQFGFDAVPIDPVALAQNNHATFDASLAAAQHILNNGRSPLLYTALGPSSDKGAQIETTAKGRSNIGAGLGRILKTLLEQSGFRRAIIAGGDSSSHALGQLDIFALTTRMPMPATPGSPLCTAYSGTSELNGIELALKGGQVGGDDYFSAIRDGRV